MKKIKQDELLNKVVLCHTQRNLQNIQGQIQPKYERELKECD